MDGYSNNSLARPEFIARKLEMAASGCSDRLAAQFSAAPRLPEAIWFIEYLSRRPGGLEALARDLVNFAGEGILPEQLRAMPLDAKGRFTFEDALTVWHFLPLWVRPIPPSDLHEMVEFLGPAAVIDARTAKEAGLSEAAKDNFRSWLTRAECARHCAKRCTERLHQALTNFFFDLEQPFPASLSCRSAAGDFELQRARIAKRAEVTRAIAAVAAGEEGTRPAVNVPAARKWSVMDNLPALLLAFMDRHAEIELARVAQTRVTRMVFEAMDYALVTRSLATIMGDSRYGKTVSIKAFCEAYPGRARLVRTPSDGGARALLVAIAKALGIAFAPGSKFRETLLYVLQHSGLMLVFDESHFLLPVTFTADTSPARLNFVRCEIIDAGLPCVLAATPQAHGSALKKFIQKTQYALEQWIGRQEIRYVLPEQYTKEDMLEVAHVQFPDIPDKVARLIVARAMQTEAFLNAMLAISKRATFLAARAGREQPSQAEVIRASDEFVNGVTLPLDEAEQQGEQFSGRRPEPTTAVATERTERLEIARPAIVA